MNIKEEMKKYDDLIHVPLGVLEERIKYLSLVSDELPEHLIPSIILGTDGPVLSSIIFTTKKYLYEVRLQLESIEFDFVCLNSITNYRFKLWEHISTVADGTTETFQMASIDLIHWGVPYVTNLAYAGPNRHRWLQSLLRAIPLRLLLENTKCV
jgi:hypothetical protein